MKRVLFLCAETFVPPYPFLHGVFNRELRKRGYEVSWIMPAEEATSVARTTWDKHDVWLIPKIRTLSGADLVPAYRRHLRVVRETVEQACRTQDVDLVQVRDDPIMAFVGGRLARARNVPFVYQVSHLKEEESLLWARDGIYGGRIKNLVKGAVGLAVRQTQMLGADAVFPISENMGRVLRRYGVPPQRIVPLPEGVDTDLIRPVSVEERARVRATLGLPVGPVVVYVGTTAKSRQLGELIEAVARLARGPKPVHLLLVGGSAHAGDLDTLKDLVRERGIEAHVTFTGAVSGDRVPAYLSAADIGVSPFPNNPVFRSNSPIKILEYMAAGLPVVATDIPAQRKLMADTGAGRLVRHDRSELARGISELLELPADELVRMAVDGRQHVVLQRDFTVLADIVDRTYARLLGAPSS